MGYISKRSAELVICLKPSQYRQVGTAERGICSIYSLEAFGLVMTDRLDIRCEGSTCLRDTFVSRSRDYCKYHVP
jgi:hypothetical protein